MAGVEPSQVPARLIVKVVLVGAAVVAALYVVYLVRDVVGLFAVATLFALAIAPLVNWLDRHRVPRWLAILSVYVGIGAAIFGIGLAIVPPLVDGVEDLSADLPGYVEDLRENETFREYDDRYGITEEVEQQAEELPSRLGDAAGALQDVTVGVFNRFIQLFSILVITFFLLIEGERILAFGYRQLPPERERRMREIAEEVSAAISGWVFGALFIATLAGLFTYGVLSLLDVPFAVPLAILFAFFDLVPLIGATVGGILVAIVVAFVDFPVALLVWAVAMLLYQQVENNVFAPLVYGKAVDIHPLVVIGAILIGASLLGILGALIAIPTAAAGQAVVRVVWRLRRGPRVERPAGVSTPEPSA